MNHNDFFKLIAADGLRGAYLLQGEEEFVKASALKAAEKLIPEDFPVPARYAHPIVLDRMIRVIREGRAQSVKEALAVVKEDLKKLDSSVQVEQEEYDEVVAVKPMFLCQEYK